VTGDSTPYPVYERGIYFEGSSPVTIQNLVLNTRFTLEFIIRPEASGNLLRVTNNEANILTTQLGDTDL
jgi:hypothetical protein